MRPVQRILVFLMCVSLLGAGCRSDLLDVDVSGIDEVVQLERFDRDLFEMDQDTINSSIGTFYNMYGDFFDIFNVHVITSVRLRPDDIPPIFPCLLTIPPTGKSMSIPTMYLVPWMKSTRN